MSFIVTYFWVNIVILILWYLSVIIGNTYYKVHEDLSNILLGEKSEKVINAYIILIFLLLGSVVFIVGVFKKIDKLLTKRNPTDDQ